METKQINKKMTSNPRRTQKKFDIFLFLIFSPWISPVFMDFLSKLLSDAINPLPFTCLVLLQFYLSWNFPKIFPASVCALLRRGLTMCSWLSSAPYINTHFVLSCIYRDTVIMVLKYSLGTLTTETACRWGQWKQSESQTSAQYNKQMMFKQTV